MTTVRRPDVAVLVLTHGRDAHLVRQQQALAAEPGWDEAIVCFMDQPDEPWEEPPPRVRTVHLDPPTAGGGAAGAAAAGSGVAEARPGSAAPRLNLAAARNAAAAATSAHTLVFLDVDCLPDSGSVAALAARCTPGRVVMADPHYLPPGWDDAVDPASVALAHPRRARLATGASSEWHMFWSLGFAIRAEDFTAVGGFDETFEGYGGEDTDFAFRCRDAGMELWLSEARVLHQPHAVHRPPLQHVDSIVVNARRFRERWGEWPMAGWLEEFARRGLVDVGEDRLTVLRAPTADEVAAARVEDAAFG